MLALGPGARPEAAYPTIRSLELHFVPTRATAFSLARPSRQLHHASTSGVRGLTASCPGPPSWFYELQRLAGGSGSLAERSTAQEWSHDGLLRHSEGFLS
jgi:hypothetical protein